MRFVALDNSHRLKAEFEMLSASGIGARGQVINNMEQNERNADFCRFLKFQVGLLQHTGTIISANLDKV